MTKLNIKKLNELIKDETMAHREYNQIAKNNPEYKTVFQKMASDEYRHAKYLMEIKKEIILKKKK